MNKVVLFFFFSYLSLAQNIEKQIERQGHVDFFSYTSVENIEANNNQALSFFAPSTGEVAVTILMNAFQFRKSLMYTHFNQSYIESDLHPNATFEGVVENFEADAKSQTKLIKGIIALRGIKKAISIKVKIEKQNGNYNISGGFDLNINDFKIKVPVLLSPNIAKTINVTFDFKYLPYEN